MFVELVYDKRNFTELPGANERILSELEKRIHAIFPAATVSVKPVPGNAAINTDASKTQKSRINEVITEMFDDAAMWLTDDD